ncbi:MAG: caspase family protein [Spirochaetota bacterium]
MKRFFLSFAFFVAAVSPVAAASLRVLIVADTNDRSIGKSVVTDVNNFEAFARQIASRTGLILDMKTIKGNDLKSKNITSAVNSLKAEKDDTVIFYYSGHGFRTQQVKTRWPLLYIPDAGQKGVDFQWVIDTINAKNPRMLLAISDSCNNYIDMPQAGINSRAMLEDSDEAWRKLFVEYSGRIYASGSTVGQMSFGQDAVGGAFTSRFLSIVRSEVKKSDASWDHIMQLATRQIHIGSPQQKTQDPQYEMVKGPAQQTPQAEVTEAPQQAHEETSSEHEEQCKALSEFEAALVSVKDSMPAKLDFRRQQAEVKSYREFVAALLQAGGDQQMVRLAQTMDQGLKGRNWPRFRSAVWAYHNRVSKIHKDYCTQ